jgi:hypothetical protein
MRELIGRHARHHGETGAYAKPSQWFTPRALVGMSQSARKRAAWHSWPNAERSLFRIGERLRPCPGCFQCSATEKLVDLCEGDGVVPAGPLRNLANPNVLPARSGKGAA